MEKLVTFKIDEQLFKRFKMTTTFNNINMTDALNNLVIDYIEKNSDNVNKLMLSEFENKIDSNV